MNGISIGHAKREDFENCKKVFDNSKLIKYYGDTLFGWIDKAIDDGEAFIATTPNGDIAGYISIKANGMFAMPDVTLLGVHEKYRGKGVGKELLQFYIAVITCLGYKEAGIVVNDFNPRARKLYDSLGFKHRKTFDCPYGLGGTCHLLVKKL